MEREVKSVQQIRSQLENELAEIKSQNLQLQNSVQTEKASYEHVSFSKILRNAKDESKFRTRKTKLLG